MTDDNTQDIGDEDDTIPNLPEFETVNNSDEDAGWTWIEAELEKNNIQPASIASIPEPLDPRDALYEIDFDKVKTVEDVCTLFKAIHIRFTGWHAGFEDFKHLVKKANDK